MGKVIMSGIVPPLVAPITGILASDLAVGSVVKLMENGVATEYLVVNQGIPSDSSLYDESCNGTWLLRKHVKEKRQWHSSDVNDYKNSTILAWLNGEFFNQFGVVEQNIIKQVKIPYVNGTGTSGNISSVSNGLSTKIFLLSAYETGVTQSVEAWVPIDGAKLDYFISGNDADAKAKRIAYLDDIPVMWWLRSACLYRENVSWGNSLDGAPGLFSCSDSSGVLPALIIPSTAIFDSKTMLLKGVA